MVSRDVVLQTVKRMYASGVDDATVTSTLHDIGLGDKEIESVISEAKGLARDAPSGTPPTAAAAKPAGYAGEQPNGIPSLVPEIRPEHPTEEKHAAAGSAAESLATRAAAKTAAAVKAQLAEARDEQALRDTTVHATMAEQAEKLEQVGKGVEELKEKTAAADSPAVKRIAALEKKLNAQQTELADIKAACNALHSLLKKILQTDRQVLVKLGGAKK